MEGLTSTSLVEDIVNTNFTYDVFLSAFSNPTLRTFTTDHVCRFLEEAGIKVYRDDILRDDVDQRDRVSFRNNSDMSTESLPTQGHMKAIEESRISVIIFSVNYTKSRWCLRVLAKMVECMKTRRHVVIPAFLGTSQSVLTAEFDSSMERYRSYSSDEMDVHRWQAAIAEVANLPGITKRNGSNAEFIRQLIQMVVDEHVYLGGKGPLVPAPHDLELKSEVEDVCSLLNRGSKDVRIIGILGRNGLRKAVLAKATFDRTFHQFEEFCFLKGDGESSPKKDPKFEMKLVSNLLAKKGRFISENVTRGNNEYEMLIVVDDIDKASQLERLENLRSYIGPGSRIIATTSDRRFLDKLKADEIYKLKLNAEDSNSSQWKYDVFVSGIRLYGTQAWCTDHICNGLEEFGLRVFRDDAPMVVADNNEICDRSKGTEITSESLPSEMELKAIEESRISVIIFTRWHAASRRCLMVIEKIMECMKTRGHVVIPAFYNISRSDLTSESGRSAQDIAKYYPNEIEAHRWRAAIAESSNLPGIWTGECKSNADFIKQFIQMVVDEHVDLGGKEPLVVPQHNVKFSSQVEHIGSFLNKGSKDVRIIGILGRNGTGKTELAKAIFDQKFHEFERFCFFKSDGHSLPRKDNNLQKMVVSNLVKKRDRFKSENATKGNGELEMLIVVDDVEKASQLKRLEKILSYIGPGCRILVTTSDRRFLDKLKVDEIYNLKSNLEDSDSAQWKYDVFMCAIRSHTIKDCITDNICNGLEELGIRVFRDDVPMDDADDRIIDDRYTGNSIDSHESIPTEESMKAIEESRICVILFTYTSPASRRWLMVAASIMERMKTKGNVVVPAFYNTTQTYHTSEEQGELIERYYPNEAEARHWCEAAAEAANLPGLEYEDCSSRADFIKQLVQLVVDEHVDLGGKKHIATMEYAGLNSHVQYLCSLLNKGSKDVRIIGILGMEGLGKTVLAKAFFNHIFHEFELFCFLRGDCSSSTEEDPDLQETLVSNLLSTRNQFKSKNAMGKDSKFEMLIVVDDIEKLSQLKAIENERMLIGPGSRIIVTTKDEHFLDKLNVDEKYKMKLDLVESIELFNRHAFGNAAHTEGYDYLMYHLVKLANGHPPALKGLSSYLAGRPIDDWKLALLKVSNIQEHQIQEKLSKFDLSNEEDTDLPRKDKSLAETSCKKSLDSETGSCSDSLNDQSPTVSRVLAESFGGSSNTVVEDVEVFLMKAPSHQRVPVMPTQERRQNRKNVRTFECPFCCKHFLNVVSTACGHVACGSCLLKSIAQNVYDFDCKVCWEQFVKALDANFDPVFCESCVIKSTAGSMKCPTCRTSIGVKGNKLDLIFSKGHGSQKSWIRN